MIITAIHLGEQARGGGRVEIKDRKRQLISLKEHEADCRSLERKCVEQ